MIELLGNLNWNVKACEKIKLLNTIDKPTLPLIPSNIYHKFRLYIYMVKMEHTLSLLFASSCCFCLKASSCLISVRIPYPYPYPFSAVCLVLLLLSESLQLFDFSQDSLQNLTLVLLFCFFFFRFLFLLKKYIDLFDMDSGVTGDLLSG